MMKKDRKITVLSFLFFFLPIPSFAIESYRDSVASVLGTVYETRHIEDQLIKVPVEDVFVSVASGKDSVQTITDRFGHFSVSGLKPGRTRIRASKLGYKVYQGVSDCSPGANIVLIKLREERIELASAIVTEEVQPVTHRGDTLVFNAAAVLTGEQDNALEILAQMPGVSIENGRITINGEPVKRTYVNGRLIFGDGVMTPLVSILASDVVNIKSYEENSIESRRYGLINAKKDRVLDITTKEPIITAFDGHVMLSGGADTHRNDNDEIQGRYGAGVVANFFSEKFLSYLTAHTNNLQKSSFRQDEFLRSEGALRNYSELSGISTGVEKYWGDRLLGNYVKASYDFSHDYIRDGERSITDYIGSDGSVYKTDLDTLKSFSTNGLHTIDLATNLFSKKAGNFYLRTCFKASGSAGSSTEGGRLSQPSAESFFQHIESSRGGRNYNVDANMSWSGNRTGNGWMPSAGISIGASHYSGAEEQADTLKTSAIYRHILADEASDSFGATANVSLGKLLNNDSDRTSSLSSSLAVSFDTDSRHRESQNMSETGILTQNLDNSYNYLLSNIGVAPEIRYDWAAGKISIVSSICPAFIRKEDRETFPVARQAGRWYFVPQGGFEIKAGTFSSNTSFRFEAPSALQFREWIDDSNPLFLTTGNASVKTSKRYNTYGSKAFPRVGKYGSLILFYNATVVGDPIVTRLTHYSEDTILPGGYVAKAGSMLQSYENSDYGFEGRASVNYQQRFQRLKTSVLVQPSFTFTRNQAYAGNDVVNLLGFSPTVTVQVNVHPSKKIVFNFYNLLSYYSSSTYDGIPINKSIVNHLRTQINYTFWKNCFFKCFYTWRSSFFFSNTGFDSSFHILDAVIGTRLIKGRMGVSVSFNDLLNSSESFKIKVNPNSRFQGWTPSSGRYILLNLSFRLNKKNPGAEYRGMLQEGGEFLPTELKYWQY